MWKPPFLARIVQVKALGGHRLRLTFKDGCVKDVDLKELFFPATGLAKRLYEDEKYFQTVRLDPESRTISWDNGFDICPDVLRFDVKTAWMEDHPEFQTLRRPVYEPGDPEFEKMASQRRAMTESTKATRSRTSPRKTTSKPARPRTRAVSKKS